MLVQAKTLLLKVQKDKRSDVKLKEKVKNQLKNHLKEISLNKRQQKIIRKKF